MATTLEFDRSLEAPAESRSGQTGAEDRRSAFRRARRRTAVVRTLRWLLPGLSLALVGSYGLTVFETTGWGTALPELSLRRILPEDLAMNNPRYEDYASDGSFYSFTAKTARQELATPSLIKLDGISGVVVQPDKSKINITAARGTFDHEKSLLELFDAIDVTSEGGLKAKLTHATIVAKEGVLMSDVPVSVEFPSGSVRSKTMTLRQKAHEVTFVDSVEARLIPPPSDQAAAQAQSAKPSESFFSASDAPIDIVAERLDVNDVTKSAVFSGKVKAVQGTSILAAPELEAQYDGAPISGGAAQAPEGIAGAGKLRRIIAKGPVMMTRDTPDVVTCDGAEFDAEGATAVLTGNVVMSSGDDRRATSQRADLDQRADTALLTGNVIVVQGRNQLHGRRLFIDRKSRRAELTAPADLDGGPGRILAHLYQAEGEDKDAKREKLGKQEEGRQAMNTGSFKADPNAPVDIEADQLDIDDAARIAVFRGSVRAAQGDFVISSAELHAFYKGEGGLADVTSGGAEGRASGGTELTRIEAKKQVVVTSKAGETATGDWASFDAKSNTVTVGGDVVLSQSDNVVRGTRLVIDMTTGKSVIDTAPPKAVALPSGGGWSAETPENAAPENRGRASAVFYPNKVKAGKKASAATSDAAAPESPGADGAAAGGN